ncbi:hypothetical protein GCM10008938_08660 [Deinococcus roseus]|uniref:Uncharacterized protein n=1 Tax=Deinococcus roseus TaxID=392414 RepID=A0ABQ2CWW7_9DEIO|nr:hypothetical protein GCM10008938_08660 [Deinococcus roseus]
MPQRFPSPVFALNDGLSEGIGDHFRGAGWTFGLKTAFHVHPFSVRPERGADWMSKLYVYTLSLVWVAALVQGQMGILQALR